MSQTSKAEKACELYQRYKTLKGKHGKLGTQMQSCSNQYFMRHWIGESEVEGEERVTLPTQANTVDMAFALLMSQKRNIRAIPVQQSAEAQNTSSDLEKFLYGVLYVNKLRAKEDRVGIALWNALVKKMGWIRYRWDEDLAEGEEPPPMLGPQMQELGPLQAAQPQPPAPTLVCKECPIVIDSVPPENMFVKWGGRRGIMYLFYAAKRYLEDVEAELGHRLRIEPYRSMTLADRAKTEVDFLEYWGWEGGKLKTATLIDDKFIPKRALRAAKGYDDIPYIPLPCNRTGEEAPHLRVKGLLDDMGGLVHLQERLLTKQNHMLHMFAFMPLVAEEGSGPPIEVDISLGNVVHLKRDQKLGFPQWPGAPPDFRWHMGVIEDKVQETGFPAVAFGKGPGTLSGYAIGQYSEGGRARLTIPRSNLSLAMTGLFQGIVSLCVNFAPDLGIPVFGEYKSKYFHTTLTGNMMKGHIIQVDIESDLPGDEMRKAVIGGQLRAQNVLSERTIMERYLGIEQPEDEIQQMLREQATKHPVAKLLGLAQALWEDNSPFYRMVLDLLLKAALQVQIGTGPGMAAQQGSAAGAAGPPAPKPSNMPSPVIPAMGQGQVLRQEQGLPPTQQEVMER